MNAISARRMELARGVHRDGDTLESELATAHGVRQQKIYSLMQQVGRRFAPPARCQGGICCRCGFSFFLFLPSRQN